MRLYLVQHAEAKRKEEDPARPLSEKGEKDIHKMAAYLKDHANIQVSAIFHSGKTRAKQTAQALAEALSPPQGIHEGEGLDPLADVEAWAKRLTSGEVDEETMLVGHLPHLSRLASRLICGNEEQEVVSFRQGGVACLERGEKGEWTVNWMLIPELI